MVPAQAHALANSGEFADPEQIRALAQQAGFTEAGIVALPHAREARDAARLAEWLGEGRAGTMQYLERTNEAGEPVRARPAIPFPWARTAIVCMASYNTVQPRSIDPAPADAAWIARYAQSSRADEGGQRRPSDYHKVLLKRLRILESKLHEQHGEFESRAYVDTGPVVERSLAVAAGLGWQAKNTCLIHPQHGSYTFLAVLLTSLPVQKVKEPTAPPTALPDRCGTCRRCIEACPTNALIAPYQMDARLCISYLTIEHRGPIESVLMEQMGRQVFGCDICQDVCPWNSKASRKLPIAADESLASRPELVNPTLDWLASLDEQAWEKLFKRLAGSSRRLPRPAPQYRNRDGKQRPATLCATAQRMERRARRRASRRVTSKGSGRRTSRRRTVGS